MDGIRFDEIAKEFGSGIPRRLMMKGLGGAGLAALVAAFGLGGEAAAHTRNCNKIDNPKRRRRCKRHNRRHQGQALGTGTVQVGGSCTTTSQCNASLCLGSDGAKICTACSGAVGETCTFSNGATVCCPVGLVCTPLLNLCV